MSTQVISKKRMKQLVLQKKKLRQKVIFCSAVIITICAVVLAFRVLSHHSDLTALQGEQVALSVNGAEMRDINPDYVGYLKIDGTAIDFPVVRGNDNAKYLHTTFGGEENIVGAIFMDYRCEGDYVPHIIIYGHEVADLDGKPLMFGGLRAFLDEEYLAQHSEITFLQNNELFAFDIFSARLTDINDPAYYLDFSTDGSFESFSERNGAPIDSERIITLATCYGDSDRRIIVQGVLKRVQ